MRPVLLLLLLRRILPERAFRLFSFRLLVDRLRLAVAVTHLINLGLGGFTKTRGRKDSSPIMCLDPFGNPAQATCSHISRPGSAVSTSLPGQHPAHFASGSALYWSITANNSSGATWPSIVRASVESILSPVSLILVDMRLFRSVSVSRSSLIPRSCSLGAQ